MRICHWLVSSLFLLFLPLIPGQVAGPAPAPNKILPPARQVITADTPVITIDGFCDGGAAKGGENQGCKTVITRAEFEAMVARLFPMATPAARLQFAQQYPEVVLFAHKARELGLDQEPAFQETLKFTVQNALSKYFLQYVQDQAKMISDAEVEKTYREHPEIFIQADLLRIYVPKRKHGPDATGDIAADEAAMKVVAEQIRAKAAAGGDFEKLEAEAYAAAGLDDTLDVHLEKETRASMSLDYQKGAFDLQPGEVSQLVISPVGFHIFKMVSKQTVPLSEAKPILQQLRQRESISSIKSSIKTQINEAYFESLTENRAKASNAQ